MPFGATVEMNVPKVLFINVRQRARTRRNPYTQYLKSKPTERSFRARTMDTALKRPIFYSERPQEKNFSHRYAEPAAMMLAAAEAAHSFSS